MLRAINIIDVRYSFLMEYIRRYLQKQAIKGECKLRKARGRLQTTSETNFITSQSHSQPSVNITRQIYETGRREGSWVVDG